MNQLFYQKELGNYQLIFQFDHKLITANGGLSSGKGSVCDKKNQSTEGRGIQAGCSVYFKTNLSFS